MERQLPRTKFSKKKYRNSKKKAVLLLEETGIRSKVIGQLKQLYKSRSSYVAQNKPNLKSRCDRGHFQCSIYHARYNWVNQDRTLFENILPSGMIPPQSKNDDHLYYKRLAKNIDLLQSKYGYPSCLTNKVLIASCDTVFVKDLPTVQQSHLSQGISIRKHRRSQD